MFTCRYTKALDENETAALLNAIKAALKSGGQATVTVEKKDEEKPHDLFIKKLPVGKAVPEEILREPRRHD